MKLRTKILVLVLGVVLFYGAPHYAVHRVASPNLSAMQRGRISIDAWRRTAPSEDLN